MIIIIITHALYLSCFFLKKSSKLFSRLCPIHALGIVARGGEGRGGCLGVALTVGNKAEREEMCLWLETKCRE